MEADRQKLLDDEKRKARDEREARVRERRRVEDDRRKKEEVIKNDRVMWEKAENDHQGILVKRGFRALRLVTMAAKLGIARAEEWHRRRVQAKCLSEILVELREKFKDRMRVQFEIEMEAELRYIRTVKM
jgi:hypothetical protein